LINSAIKLKKQNHLIKDGVRNEYFKAILKDRTGDHIDLWNKNKITSSGMFMRDVYEFFVVLSDLNKSKGIWFWEVK